MGLRPYTWILLASFLSLPLEAAEECAAPPPRREPAYELGLVLETLFPSRLPGFDGTLPVYGAVFAMPLWGNSLQLNALYGAADALSVKLFELGYQLNLETPHFIGFGLGGIHHLNYTSPVGAQKFIGGFLGVGAVVPMGQSFSLNVFFKSYFQTQPMLAMGGAFRLTL